MEEHLSVISFFFLKEKGVGVFGFTILVIFQIGFSVSAFKKSGFSVWVSSYFFIFFSFFSFDSKIRQQKTLLEMTKRWSLIGFCSQKFGTGCSLRWLLKVCIQAKGPISWHIFPVSVAWSDQVCIPSWIGCQSTVGLAPALNSPLPIILIYNWVETDTMREMHLA